MTFVLCSKRREHFGHFGFQCDFVQLPRGLQGGLILKLQKRYVAITVPETFGKNIIEYWHALFPHCPLLSALSAAAWSCPAFLFRNCGMCTQILKVKEFQKRSQPTGATLLFETWDMNSQYRTISVMTSIWPGAVTLQSLLCEVTTKWPSRSFSGLFFPVSISKRLINILFLRLGLPLRDTWHRRISYKP